jgi:DNA-binding Lrp family transcriptional regulator
VIDEIDRSILSLLIEDSRRTYDDIGYHVGLSAPAVKRRVDKLLASGTLVGFTAHVNHAALGSTMEALVEVLWRPGTKRSEVYEGFRKNPNVIEATIVTGASDVLVKVRVSDAEELDRVLLEMSELEFVDRTRTSIVLKQLVPPR